MLRRTQRLEFFSASIHTLLPPHGGQMEALVNSVNIHFSGPRETTRAFQTCPVHHSLTILSSTCSQSHRKPTTLTQYTHLRFVRTPVRRGRSHVMLTQLTRSLNVDPWLTMSHHLLSHVSTVQCDSVTSCKAYSKMPGMYTILMRVAHADIRDQTCSC